MRKSIRGKLIISFVLLILMPMLVLGVNAFSKSVTLMEESLKANTMGIVEEAGHAIDIFLKGMEENLSMMSTDPNVEQVFSNADSALWMMGSFKNFKETHPEVLYVYLGSKDKKMHIYPETQLSEGFDPTTRPWYQDAMAKNDVVWTEPYVDDGSGQLIISVAKPVYDTRHNNEFVGVIAFDITLQHMSDFINDIRIGELGYAMLIDKAGNLMTHPDKELIGKPMPVEVLAEAIQKEKISVVDYTMEEAGKDEEKFGVFITLERTGWRVLGNMYIKEIRSQYNVLLKSSLVIGLGALLIAIVISFLLSISITRPIRALAKDMEKIKEGDFTIRCDIKSKDEVGSLGASFNTMADGLQHLVEQVREVVMNVTASAEILAATSEQSSASAEEVARTVEEIAKGASEQAIESEKGSTLVTDLANKLNMLLENTGQMENVSNKAKNANDYGIQTMELLMDRTKYSNHAIDRIVQAVGDLNNESQHIDSILNTISAIADQTNLLALNAAIEAARAGEAGRGFAVVADEIRKLAEQSGQSTEKIKHIVHSIQNHTRMAVEIMDEVKNSNMQQGLAVDDVNKSFENIFQAIRQIGQGIESINTYVLDMNKDGQNIVGAIENISAVSEETAAASEEVSAAMEQQTSAVEEVARAADKLNELALQLNKEFQRFKV